MDGMKFNQVQDLWVLDSRVQPDHAARHRQRGRAPRRLLPQPGQPQTGGGLGIEAKGGSVDVLYDGNLFHRVRRVELGGEETDATYYFSARRPLGLRGAARDGAQQPDRRRARSRARVFGLPGLRRIEQHHLLQPRLRGAAQTETPSTAATRSACTTAESWGPDDGAGSDCQFWDEALQDHVTVDPCWGVGARPPAPGEPRAAQQRADRGQQPDRGQPRRCSASGRWRLGGALPAEHRVGGDTRAGDGRQPLVERRASRLPTEGCSERARKALSAALLDRAARCPAAHGRRQPARNPDGQHQPQRLAARRRQGRCAA